MYLERNPEENLNFLLDEIISAEIIYRQKAMRILHKIKRNIESGKFRFEIYSDKTHIANFLTDAPKQLIERAMATTEIESEFEEFVRSQDNYTMIWNRDLRRVLNEEDYDYIRKVGYGG